ncbi:MAG: oxidative damage protection protein [Pseudomonadaceae bacterium]|nr:oxidative damage protection protein [Pseudomonadaceae bacterium]
MSRTVLCSRYGEELEGLDKPPIPGAAGERIFNEVSKKAWLEWQNLQTMLINEKHLKLLDPDARKYLSEQMWLFFANEEVDRAEGYVAPPKS